MDSNLCILDIWLQSTNLSAVPPQFALPPRDTPEAEAKKHKYTSDDIHPVLLQSILEDTCRGPGLDWPHRHQPLHMTWTGRDQDPPDFSQWRGQNVEGGSEGRDDCR